MNSCIYFFVEYSELCPLDLYPDAEGIAAPVATPRLAVVGSHDLFIQFSVELFKQPVRFFWCPLPLALLKENLIESRLTKRQLRVGSVERRRRHQTRAPIRVPDHHLGPEIRTLFRVGPRPLALVPGTQVVRGDAWEDVEVGAATRFKAAATITVPMPGGVPLVTDCELLDDFLDFGKFFQEEERGPPDDRVICCRAEKYIQR